MDRDLPPFGDNDEDGDDFTFPPGYDGSDDWVYRDFGDESAEALKDDVPFDVSRWKIFDPSTPETIDKGDTPVDEAARKHAEQVAAQATQNTGWRKTLFWTVYWIVLAFATVNCVGIIVYLALLGKEANPVVLSTWAVGSVAQVVGLMLVITKHLFPSTHDDFPAAPVK